VLPRSGVNVIVTWPAVTGWKSRSGVRCTAKRAEWPAIVVPSLAVRRALPLNQAVEVEFLPERAGDIALACGMNMLQGTIVVQ
jgi:plastocyanin domain-containing protein